MSTQKKAAGPKEAKKEKVRSSQVAWVDARSHLHCRLGWWWLLVFLTLGAVLETLHWLEAGWYLDAAGETRRLMWRLAHAHGTLLGLVHLGFGITLNVLPPHREGLCKLASRCLLAAGVLLPGGFFLGGIVVYGGDPGLGILLVPAGALLLFIAILISALAGSRRSLEEHE